MWRETAVLSEMCTHCCLGVFLSVNKVLLTKCRSCFLLFISFHCSSWMYILPIGSVQLRDLECITRWEERCMHLFWDTICEARGAGVLRVASFGQCAHSSIVFCIYSTAAQVSRVMWWGKAQSCRWTLLGKLGVYAVVLPCAESTATLVNRRFARSLEHPLRLIQSEARNFFLHYWNFVSSNFTSWMASTLADESWRWW